MRPGRKRELVDEMCREWQVSIRRACDALEFDRSTYHYRSRRSGQAALEDPKIGSRRFAMFAFATPIAVSTSCCAGRDGRDGPNKTQPHLSRIGPAIAQHVQLK